MSQAKEQQKSPQSELKDIDEIEAAQIPGTEFRIMVIRMLKSHRRRIDDLSENINR